MPLITNVVRGSDADRLLLLVHGFGADERDLGGLLPYLDPDGQFVTVLPRGPVALPGMPGFAWYDFGLPAAEIAAAFASALDELDDLLDEAAAEHDLPRAEAIVGGFSQGAGLALGTGAPHQRPPASARRARVEPRTPAGIARRAPA